MTHMFIIVGLGNPGEKYEYSRHNAGRMVLEEFVYAYDLPAFVDSSKYASRISEGKVGKEKVFVMLPETYMNKSGSAVKKVVTSTKKAEKLVVVYDDIDLPLGVMKISYGRGDGGHNGLKSIIRAVRTKNFIRVRVGVSPVTLTGKPRKPKGEQKVLDFLLGDFKKSEEKKLQAVLAEAAEALEMIVLDGREVAMNEFN